MRAYSSAKPFIAQQFSFQLAFGKSFEDLQVCWESRFFLVFVDAGKFSLMLSSFSLPHDCWIINCRVCASRKVLRLHCCVDKQRNEQSPESILSIWIISVNEEKLLSWNKIFFPRCPRCIHSWIFKCEKAMQFIKLNYLIIHSWRTRSALFSPPRLENRSLINLNDVNDRNDMNDVLTTSINVDSIRDSCHCVNNLSIYPIDSAN